MDDFLILSGESVPFSDLKSGERLHTAGGQKRKAAAAAAVLLHYLFSVVFLAEAREDVLERVDDFGNLAVVAADRFDGAEDLVDERFDEIHSMFLHK